MLIIPEIQLQNGKVVTRASISGDEIRRYWPDLQEIERYDDIDNGPPKFRDAGLQEMFESVWR